MYGDFALFWEQESLGNCVGKLCLLPSPEVLCCPRAGGESRMQSPDAKGVGFVVLHIMEMSFLGFSKF